jgi:hypothetical protein
VRLYPTRLITNAFENAGRCEAWTQRQRKPVVQPLSRFPEMSRNTACHPLALVIGLAVGETRWRDMTAAAGGRDHLARRRSPTRRSTPFEGFWGRLAQYFR